MKVGALFSGGKDSTYAAWLATKRDRLECLVTLFPRVSDSYMFHYPNLEWTRLQAQAAGLPQVTRATEGVKEEELSDLKAALQQAVDRFGIEGVYTGALASVYQKSRVEGVCEGLGLACVSPLWKSDPELHLRRLVQDGFVAIIVSVSALGLDDKWLGRPIDGAAIKELAALAGKYRFHMALEGGEGETFVVDCPLFRSRIEVVAQVNHWAGDSGYLEITQAKLVAKNNANTKSGKSLNRSL